MSSACTTLRSVTAIAALLLAPLAGAETRPAATARSTTAPGSPGTSIPLQQPTSVAYDGNGNLYFAESRNNVVRRLDTAGNLLSIVGNAQQGFSGDGGPASAAELDTPRGVALDLAGNLYIADTRNNRIRRVDVLTHVITTIAGTGVTGFGGDGAAAISATLSLPVALALDGQNHLFLSDSGNQRIRRIDLSTGLIVTVAGDGHQGFSGDGGPATSASLDNPSGIASDPFGNLFIADTGNRRVREVGSASRTIVTVAGDGASGIQFRRPEGLSLNGNGGLLIADAASHQIYLFDLATGRLALVAGQGTQAFSGDRGLATLAMLDSPAAIAVGPAGVLAIADTGNQRIREVSPLGVPDTPSTIVTVAGLGTAVPGTLMLAGSATQAYGSVRLSASLTFGASAPIGTQAQGELSVLDATSGTNIALLTSALSSSTIPLDLSHLSAGTHRLLATYTGDSTHAAAQSAIFQLTVAPLPVSADVRLPSVVFGQAVPTLAGNLTGVLPQDTGAVSLSLSATLPSPAPPGTYPIQASLSGTAASNYQLVSAPASLTITQAPVTVTLAQAGETLNLRVASTTTGTPTGAITLLTAAGSQLASAPLSNSGSLDLSDTGLPSGTYSLTAVYTGDVDFLPARSSPVAVTLGSTAPAAQPPSFAFASTGSSSQTLSAGATATFPFSVAATGAPLSSPITLAVSGLPPFATAAFDPAIIPPGGAVSSFNLTVVTAAASSDLHRPSRATGRKVFTLCALLPVFLLLPKRRRRFLPVQLLFVLGMVTATVPLSGCGDRINAAADSSGAAPVTYTLAVTGTATANDGSVLQHSTLVKLTLR